MRTNFEADFDYFVRENNVDEANRVLMEELGRILVQNKTDFVDLLNESGVPADINMNDAELVNNYIENIGHNRNLMVGSALLINHHNKTVGFDGENEMDDDRVKDAYAVMYSYFDDVLDIEDAEEESSEFWGDVVGKVGGALGKGAEFGKQIYRDRRRQKHGATDEFYAQREAKRQMIQQILEQRRQQQINEQKRIEANRKTTNTILIVGGAVVFAAVIIGGIYLIRKNKTSKKP